MIYVCPYCGDSLPNKLLDGISYCGGCEKSFDSSKVNRILNAAWMIFRQNPSSIEKIQKAVNLTNAEAILLEAFMMHSMYSMEEFKKALEELRSE